MFSWRPVRLRAQRGAGHGPSGRASARESRASADFDPAGDDEIELGDMMNCLAQKIHRVVALSAANQKPAISSASAPTRSRRQPTALRI